VNTWNTARNRRKQSKCKFWVRNREQTKTKIRSKLNGLPVLYLANEFVCMRHTGCTVFEASRPARTVIYVFAVRTVTAPWMRAPCGAL